MVIFMKQSVFSILFYPKEFIRSGRMPSKLFTCAVAWCYGMTYLFGKACSMSLGNTYRFSVILLVNVCLAVFIGLVAFYICSFFLYLFGKVFRGEANFSSVLNVFIWVHILEIGSFFSWVCLMLLHGSTIFSQTLVQTNKFFVLTMGLLIVQIIFSIWQIVILFRALEEAQNFSPWRSILSVLCAWICLLLLDVVISWLVTQHVWSHS